MDFKLLASEISDDPLNVGYDGMSDADVASSLNAVIREQRKLVPLWQVKKACVENGLWRKIGLAITDQALTPTVRDAAAAAVAYIDDKRFENLDMDLTSTKNMLAALVVGNVIPQALATALDGMADFSVSRASEIGIGVVSADDVAIARGTRPLVQMESA